MSTQINVYVGGENLLPRSQGVQQDNRWRLSEQEQQRIIDASVEQAQADLRQIRQLDAPRRDLFRRQEIAANRRGVAVETLAYVYTARASAGVRHYVFSMDGTQYDEFLFDYNPPTLPTSEPWYNFGQRSIALLRVQPSYPAAPLLSWEYNNGWLFLPVGRAAAVGLFCAAKAWTAYTFSQSGASFTAQGVDMLTRAYIIGQSSLRQIGVPGVVQSYMEYQAEPTFSSIPYQFLADGNPPFYIPFNRVVADPIGSLQSPSAYQYLRYDDVANPFDEGYGPGAIAYVANPISARAALDNRPGGQSIYQAAYNYIQANYPPIPPRIAQTKERLIQPDIGDLSVIAGRPVSEELHILRDWARPSYCRQRLLALGFSESDLTP